MFPLSQEAAEIAEAQPDVEDEVIKDAAEERGTCFTARACTIGVFPRTS